MRVIGVRLLVMALMLLALFLVVTLVRVADAYDRRRIAEEIERRGYCTQ